MGPEGKRALIARAAGALGAVISTDTAFTAEVTAASSWGA